MAIGTSIDKSFGQLFKRELGRGEGKLLVGIRGQNGVELLKEFSPNELKTLLAEGGPHVGADLGKAAGKATKAAGHATDHVVIKKKPPVAKKPGKPAPSDAPVGRGGKVDPANPAVPVVTNSTVRLTARAWSVFQKLGLAKPEATRILQAAEAVRNHALAGGKSEQEAFAEAEGYLKKALPKADGAQLNLLRESISPKEQGKIQRLINWRKNHAGEPTKKPAPKKPAHGKAEPAKKPAHGKTEPAKPPVAPKKTHKAPKGHDVKKPVEPKKPSGKGPVVVPNANLARDKSIFVFVSGAVQAIKTTLDGLVAGLRKLLNL